MRKPKIGTLTQLTFGSPFGIEMREDSAFPDDESYGESLVQRNATSDKIKIGYLCLADHGIEIGCSLNCGRCQYAKKVSI
jgi:hypothetical protein